MNPAQWTQVDQYLTSQLVPEDDVLSAALASSQAAGLPAINVAPNQGKLLHLLAKLRGAQRILEIGTLGGYSTLWLARALPPSGKIVTLELDPRHAAVARENFARAGVSHQIDLRVGRATESLAQLIAEEAVPFEFIFIDADKAGIPGYFAQSLNLSRPGTLIVVDNVVRQGAVADAASTDVSVQGVRKFFELVRREARVDATAIQTVGSKGYDGFALLVVKG